MRVLSICAQPFNAPQSQMVIACTTSDTTDDSIFLTSASTTRGSVVSFEAAPTPGDAPMRSRKLSMDSVASSVSFEDHCESSPAKARVPDEPQHSLPNDVALGPIMSEALAAVSFGAGAHEARFSRLWTQQHCRELTASFTWHAVCEQFQEKDAPPRTASSRTWPPRMHARSEARERPTRRTLSHGTYPLPEAIETP
jgi:hypothetical protein